MCARKEQYLLFDLFKARALKKNIFSFICARFVLNYHLIPWYRTDWFNHIDKSNYKTIETKLTRTETKRRTERQNDENDTDKNTDRNTDRQKNRKNICSITIL